MRHWLLDIAPFPCIGTAIAKSGPIMIQPATADLPNRSGGMKLGFLWVFVAMSVLVVANILAFSSHYQGQLAFPWDFVGGYHAHAFAWYADGSFFHPPKWFAWGDLGFPAYWSLQSGAYYLPLAALDLLDQPYTMHAAVLIQGLHVLAGGVGMYILLRTLKFDVLLALAGAAAFHFSSSFYSNAQHVDIVRATALLPWLMWCLHPEILLRSWVRPIIAAVLLSQFLVAAYPGMIVAAAYTLLLFVGGYVIKRRDSTHIVRTLAILALVGISAVAMAMPKWLPPLVEGDLASVAFKDRMGIDLPLLPTLFLPFDRAFLPNDLTMRSLWLPAGFLTGMVFLNCRSVSSQIAFALVIAALLFGGIGPALLSRPLPLPGMGISRFPLADWRPTLHVGLIVLACEGWHNLLSRQTRLASMVLRSGFAAGCIAPLLYYSLTLGYTWEDWLVPLTAVLTAASLAFALALTSTRERPRTRLVQIAPVAALIALTSAEGLAFHHRESRTWQVGWSSTIERQMFGGMLTSEGMPDRPPRVLERRPRRFTVGTDYQSAVKLQNDTTYNRCFYAPTFCTFGYNNLRLSRPHATFRNAILNPEHGPKLLELTTQAQKLIVLPADAAFHPDVISEGANDEPIETLVPGVTGSVIGYGGDWARYRLSTPRDVRVVENEIWTNGWSVRLCQNGRCLEPIKPEHTPEYLRTWIVPAGTWDILVFFKVHSSRYSWMLFFAGVFTTSLAGVAVYKFRKARIQAPQLV
ncbi:hypothetical protein ACFOYU_12580 [Microvirga sp. GCM10011540]|uniref:hypothetical protein n=1 Tax=Microvirga sp. GCM10011540 TaxID=3317338 RepID=UPI00360E9F3A